MSNSQEELWYILFTLMIFCSHTNCTAGLGTYALHMCLDYKDVTAGAAYLEVEEHCEEAEEERHCRETKYEEGLPADSLDHQALEQKKKV